MIRDMERSTRDAETLSPRYNRQCTGEVPAYDSFYDEGGTLLLTPALAAQTEGQAITLVTDGSPQLVVGHTIVPVVSPLNELQRIADLPADWDSYGSAPPTTVAVGTARRLINTVYRDSLLSARNPSLPFSVAPLSGGGIQLEWRGETNTIEVEVGPEGAFGYLLIKGAEPSSVYEEEDGVSESRILELVRSVQR